jgi:hypothetical protein
MVIATLCGVWSAHASVFWAWESGKGGLGWGCCRHVELRMKEDFGVEEGGDGLWGGGS